MSANTRFYPSPSAASWAGNPAFLQSIAAMSDADGQENAESYKVLLVDDNVDLLEVAATLFRGCGFEVIATSSAMEAMDILRRTPDIDVLFSDVVMPGVSGIQLGYEARKIRPGIKVILVSGYATVAANAGHGSLRDFDFLKKPYHFSDILKLLATPD
ncbi:MAG TPA: response regulator [Noviherbaspirillum sp.]|jgi:DNA-binding NtrC family response regulator|uniref:response regulator n=1 Tax=Noviherbaspirillum sp. TaxID=1926288 RepID=UPI002F9446DA